MPRFVSQAPGVKICMSSSLSIFLSISLSLSFFLFYKHLSLFLFNKYLSFSLCLSLSFSFFPFSSSLLSIFLPLSLFFINTSLCVSLMFLFLFSFVPFSFFLIPSSIWSVCLSCYLRKLSQSFLLLFCSKNHNCFTFFAPFVRILSSVVVYLSHALCTFLHWMFKHWYTDTLSFSLIPTNPTLSHTHSKIVFSTEFFFFFFSKTWKVSQLTKHIMQTTEFLL